MADDKTDAMVENEESVGEVTKKQVSVVRTPLFSKIYATNLIVNKTDSDFRIELFNEKFESKKGWAYHSDGLVIMTAQAAKILLGALGEKIEEYEKENGEIIIAEDRKTVQEHEND